MGEYTNRRKRASALNNYRKSESYSGIRSGAVDLLESGLGLGDELDGLIRRLSGDAATYDEGIDQSRRDLDYFERKNPLASKLITGAGIGASLLIPGATAAKIAQTGSRMARAVKMGAAASVEGAAYGYAAGRDEERKDTAAMGAAFGGAIGLGVGGFLTKGAEELEAIKKADSEAVGVGGAIGGEKGYKKKGAVARKSGVKDISSSARERKYNSYDDVEIDNTLGENKFKTTGKSVFLNARNWGYSYVGERPTRLIEDADVAMRTSRAHNDRLYKDNEAAYKLLDENRSIKLAIANLGKTPVGNARSLLGLEEKRAIGWDDVYRQARDESDIQAIDLYKAELEDAVELGNTRFSDWSKGPIADDLYAPRATKGDGKQATGYEREDGTEVGNLDNLKPPSEALREFRNDISDAVSAMDRFEQAGVIFGEKIKGADILSSSSADNFYQIVRGDKQQSRLGYVMESIKKSVKEEVLSTGGARAEAAAISENMDNLMSSVFINSRTGGDAVGAMVRKTASTALLANPVNAVLNLAETVTAPIYQNGVAAWAQTLPGLVKSGLMPRLGQKDQKWLSANQLGVSDDQFAGELMNAGQSNLSKWINWASQGLYKYTGTSGSHRMTQEALGNSAIKRGVSLAKSGNLKKLRKHKGVTGLTDSEFDATVNALKRFDEVGIDGLSELDSGYFRNFAGTSMNEWQAISPMSMPKAFLDNPNGRIGYSMLSYMNINMNNVIYDIGGSLKDVAKYGLNTAEGQRAYRAATKNAAKYVAMFGVVAGIWDDMRKTMDATSDYEVDKILTFEGISNAAVNQFASNMTTGLLNIRAEEYGGQPLDILNPAPISLARRGLNAAAGLVPGLFGGDVNVDPALRFVESSVPGLSQANKLSRMGLLDPDNFERLLEGKPYDAWANRSGKKLLSE
jgi:hypothetical protein